MVSREKAIVEVETDKAQKEAAIVAEVEREVSGKAADTKADLDKAEPAVIQVPHTHTHTCGESVALMSH